MKARIQQMTAEEWKPESSAKHNGQSGERVPRNPSPSPKFRNAGAPKLSIVKAD